MKAQAALEFTMIIGIVLVAFTGFLYILSNQVTEIAENEDSVAIHNLANSILNEINVARQVHSNYLRYFDIEPKLNGKNYELKLLKEENQEIEKNVLTINIIEHNDNPPVAYAFGEGITIHGDFVEVKDGSHRGYCITRDNSGNIMISKNQISFKPGRQWDITQTPNGWKDIPEDEFNGITATGITGSKFTLYLMANCVKDFSLLDVTINHPGFTYNKAYEVITHDVVKNDGKDANIYGNDMFDGETKKALFTSTKNGDKTRITITQIGNNNPSGTDALVELEFTHDDVNKIDLSLYVNDYVDYNNLDSGNPIFSPPTTKPISVSTGATS